MKKRLEILGLFAVLALPACAAQLEPTDDGDDAGWLHPDGGAIDEWIPMGHFRVKYQGDVVHVRVNATSYESFRYFDLDAVANDEDPARWDLRFQRMAVEMNGGVTGEGGVVALVLDGVSFDEVSVAPASGYSAPVPDSDDRDQYADSVFTGDHDEPGNAWYEYTVDGHVLTPRPWVYVVKSTEGRAYKLAFDGYYDEAGSPANVQFRFAEIDLPD